MPRKKEDRAQAQHIAQRLGTRLRGMRKAGHRTQDEISSAIGLTTEAYARIERGLSLPSFPTLMRLCSALETRPDLLLLEEISHATATEDVSSELAALNGELRHLDLKVVRDISRLARTLRSGGAVP
jgi:transcriptional regulator with XRE-family HTH domain